MSGEGIAVLSPLTTRPSPLEDTPLVEVVGVSFRRAGRIYYFDPVGLALKAGDSVIAETQRGVDMGEVKTEIRTISPEQVTPPLRQVVRIATPDEIARREA